MATRAPVSTAVFDALRARILGGELAVGDAMDSERDLAERFAVNRHAVREALKRLQQAGLITVTQGGATRVTDWRTQGGMELLAGLALHRGGDELLRAALEMRRTIGVDAAGLCARRADEDTLAEIVAADAAIVSCVASTTSAFGDRPQNHDSVAALESAYRTLWAAIVDGADNLAYRLALNSLIVAIDADLALAIATLAAELQDGDSRERLVSAIVAGDEQAARAAARQLLSTSVHNKEPAWSS